MQPMTADLFGAFIAFALWGIYTCLFLTTIWSVRTHKTDRFTSPIMLAIQTLYVINLAAVVLECMSFYYEFIPDAVPLSERGGRVLTTLMDICICVAMVVADSALVWRLWIVWLRDYRIMVIPVLAWLGLLGCGLAVLILDVIQTLAGKNASWETRYQSTAAALIYISMGLNWLVTGLIVGRLWWADRKLKATYRSADSAPRTSYTKIMVALIESGAFYSIYLVAYLIGNYAGNGAGQYLFMYALPVVVGTVPCLIQLQRSLGFLQPNETVNGTGASFTKASSVRPTNVHLAVRMETHTELTNYTDRTRPSEKTPARPSQADDTRSLEEVEEGKGSDFP